MNNIPNLDQPAILTALETGFCDACQSRVIEESGNWCQVCSPVKIERIAQVLATELPSLTGSDKQIAWAEKIRTRSLEIMDQNFAKGVVYRSLGPDPKIFGTVSDRWRDYRVEIAAVTESKWWINHRDNTKADGLIRHLREGCRCY